MAAAAVSYAFGASYAKRRIRSVRPHVAAAFGVFFATLYTWPVVLIADGFVLPRTFEAIASILWLGFLGTFVAYLLYFGLIERLGATRASTVAYLFPVVRASQAATDRNGTVRATT